MNADASPGVTVDMAVGAKTGALLPIGVGMLAVAIVLFVGGAAMVIAGSTGRRSNPQGNGPASPSSPPRVPANVA